MLKWVKALSSLVRGQTDIATAIKEAKELREDTKQVRGEMRQITRAVMSELHKNTGKGSIQDIRNFCDEIRKDVAIIKGSSNRLWVEWGNLQKKIERLREEDK